MNLCGHCTSRKAGVKARRPMVPSCVLVDPAGGAAPAMRAERRDEAGGEAEQTEKQSFDAPLPGAPNVGFRVPQTLERFELWGACEELVLPSLPTH